jgi:hypothetical protein
MNELDSSSLPRNLNRNELIELAKLAIGFPLSEKWIAISKLLTPEQKVEINKRIESLKFEKDKKRNLKPESQGMDEKTWNEIKEAQEAHKFYGNMGQPDTPIQFKNRYGVWPPGYDENGNKNFI